MRVYLLLILFSLPASASILIPGNLSQKDRAEVVRILGLGTSSKILTDPYPLGGHSGVEIGVAVESLPIDDLSRLGNRTTSQSNFVYPKIILGKGLYNNVDLFANFIPFNESTGLSEYGAMVRWGFYQTQFVPATFSIIGHANNSNVNNKFTSQSFGTDVMMGMNVSNFSLFIGGGKTFATGRFTAGTQALTDSGAFESESVDSTHTVVGAALQIFTMQMVFQIDQYTETVFSGKLGGRF